MNAIISPAPAAGESAPAAALPFGPYEALSDEAADERIRKAKAALGERLVLLAHHYQRDEVFRHADFTGDSLKLSRYAASSKADYIVFCGVHFMAEVADILSRPDQVAILPDLSAGCSMADMASTATVERAWSELATWCDPDRDITPITYINSSAALKAFCARHGGIVCTSSNARQVLEWAFSRRPKVLFFPDQHLGRWTGHRMGIPLSHMALWDFSKALGGLSPAAVQESRMLLWGGYCGVHQLFEPGHIDAFRARVPGGKVIAHPECSFEVCEKADAVGSTEFIIRTVHDSPPGTHWLVGTEINLVQRLDAEVRADGKSAEFMSPMTCHCSTMYRIDPQHLAWALENLVAGQVVNPVQVPEAIAREARIALERMLEVSP